MEPVDADTDEYGQGQEVSCPGFKVIGLCVSVGGSPPVLPGTYKGHGSTWEDQTTEDLMVYDDVVCWRIVKGSYNSLIEIDGDRIVKAGGSSPPRHISRQETTSEGTPCSVERIYRHRNIIEKDEWNTRPELAPAAGYSGEEGRQPLLDRKEEKVEYVHLLLLFFNSRIY